MADFTFSDPSSSSDMSISSSSSSSSSSSASGLMLSVAIVGRSAFGVTGVLTVIRLRPSAGSGDVETDGVGR